MIRDPRPLRPLTRAQLLTAIACALLVAWCDVRVTPDGVHGAWFFAIIGVIWGALQTAWSATQTAISFVLQNIIIGLRWAVTNLGKALASGLAKAAIYTAKAMGVVWRALRSIFEPVLRWMGKALEAVGGFLRRVFEPILEWLNRAREWILRIYERFVRPVLQVLDILRQVFRLLAALGFDWARAIDRALGRISAAIQLPFQWIIAKINEVIGVINRIVTLDGLLQRLTLLRSLIRDVAYTNRLFWNSQTYVYSEGEIAGIRARNALPTIAARELDYVRAIESDDGPLAAAAREFWQDFELRKDQPLGTERPDQHEEP